MKTKLSLALLVTILLSLFWHGNLTPVAASQSLLTDETTHIKQATILITMQAPAQQKNALAHGMASLVQSKGEAYLVTHNHWGEVLQDLTTVELRDADNHLILPIFGKEFKRLTAYQDAGTRLLHLPDGWRSEAKPATLGLELKLDVGDTVQVAYREKLNRTSVAGLEATIQAVSEYEGLPIYELRSLDGQTLLPGDSGGGVWYQGVLVANNWAVVTATTPQAVVGQNSASLKIYTDESYAAIVPEKLKE